jgi:hypothetical protein
MTEKLTKKKAKELSLEVWRYLAEHPEIRDKRNLPPELYEKIKGMSAHCSLCELFKGDCLRCPLGYCDDGSFFMKWEYSRTYKSRREVAMKIVRRIEAWDIGEEYGS